MEPFRRARLPALSASEVLILEDFVAELRSVFHRNDQALRFAAYLRGLLESIDRKNVESIALAASRAMSVDSGLAQALQHFVSQSPWDERRLMSALRARAGERSDPAATWVIHDVAFAKKGLHSVGVMRQFARSLGKKINCQVGVMLSQVGPNTYSPLAARLYLPASWLRLHASSLPKLVPEEHRRPFTRAELALTLIDEVRDSTSTLPVVAESGYWTDAHFEQGLRERGLTRATESERPLESALRHLSWLQEVLGLDHFEGRTWHGWHHHVHLVFAAFYFLRELPHRRSFFDSDLDLTAQEVPVSAST